MAQDQDWLDTLPALDEPDEGVVVSGIAVGAPAGRIRLLVTDVCVDFATADVADSRVLASLPGIEAARVELRLKPGATVIAVQDADALFVGEAFGEATFPYAARRNTSPTFASPAYRELERDYTRRWHLAGES